MSFQTTDLKNTFPMKTKVQYSVYYWKSNTDLKMILLKCIYRNVNLKFVYIFTGKSNGLLV